MRARKPSRVRVRQARRHGCGRHCGSCEGTLSQDVSIDSGVGSRWAQGRVVSSFEELTERVRAGLATGDELDKVLKLNLKGEGVIRIDGLEVSNADAPADLTITATRSDLEALGSGRMDPMSAIISGRLRVSDTGLAMRLQPQLQSLFAKLR